MEIWGERGGRLEVNGFVYAAAPWDGDEKPPLRANPNPNRKTLCDLVLRARCIFIVRTTTTAL